MRTNDIKKINKLIIEKIITEIEGKWKGVLVIIGKAKDGLDFMLSNKKGG